MKRNNMERLNTCGYALYTDKYEHTMMYGYFKENKKDDFVFDMFFRSVPDGGGYAICAGLESVIEIIQNLKFTDQDIEFLRKTTPYDEDFLNYLKNDYTFNGSIWAVPEGSIIFPNEPIVKVKANPIVAQHIEDILLTFINSQSLIATKASRICYAANGEPVADFGLRRGPADKGSVFASRAAYIGGCVSTSNEIAAMTFGIPDTGTMAHSWVLMHENEVASFREYASIYKENVILLVDTYDTLKSGIPNAITVFKELRETGKLPKSYGIRLDSGDLAYLSKKARIMLDKAGFTDAIICASNNLNERLIQQLKSQDAKINFWATGTELITSYSCPAFNGVYKLAARSENGKLTPVIKLSEDKVKVTNPGDKKVYRIVDKETGYYMADIICLASETFDESKDLTIFDPEFTAKKKTFKAGSYSLKELLVPIFEKGTCVYDNKSTEEIRNYCQEELSHLWPEVRRFDFPHKYYVDLSLKLYTLKENLISTINNKED